MHILIARDLDTHVHWRFLEGDLGWRELFDKAELIVGHNIINFDLSILQRLFGYKPPKHVRLHDTLLMSQILDYRRFGLEGHSLDRWGEHLGFPKLAFTDFAEYSPEMETYCDRDVDLNERVYGVLRGELLQQTKKNPQLATFLRNEHKAAVWQQQAQLHGWPMNRLHMEKLFLELSRTLRETEEKLKLGYKFVYPDKVKGIVEPKTPRLLKNGCYAANVANWFDVYPEAALEDRPIEGDYSRVTAQALKLSYAEDVKIFLFRHGWEPTEWNMKRDETTGKMVKTSPKIDEDSLELLGGEGKRYADYVKIKSRHGVLSGWLDVITTDDRLHGDSMIIGTPSMRLRHQIIANIPSRDAMYGPEVRELFTTLPGWKLVGCDSSGNQARGLAHYLNNTEFTKQMLEGDIHQHNADILTTVLKQMGIEHTVPRAAAKRVLYAFLFGASGSKLWSYIFGVNNAALGNRLKDGFTTAVPGFKALMDKLESVFGSTKKLGWGYIYSIAGNRIYVDSFHKLLVYLLQSCEKATCSAALAVTMEELDKAGIPYVPLIYYHDEIDFMVPEEYAEQAATIGKLAFKEAPKQYGITIMDGDAKIGNNWLEIH